MTKIISNTQNITQRINIGNIDAIQEINNKLGSNFTNISLDGNYHHASDDNKNKKPYWYIGSESVVKGELIYHISCGDFRIDSRYYITSQNTKKLSEEQRYIIKEEQIKQKEIVLKEIERRHLECYNKWYPIWKKAPTVTNHPYLNKKLIAPNYLPKQIKTLNDDRLFIPMFDQKKEFKGGQLIDNDQIFSKRFIFGSKIQGSFFPFGNIRSSSTVLVAEGFATAFTVWKCTQIPTLCVFSSNNIENVILAIREINTNCSFIICADNDHETAIKHPKIGNPGILKAIEICEKYDFVDYVIPTFIDSKEKSDFNDLYSDEGENVVKSQILAPSQVIIEISSKNTIKQGPIEIFPEVAFSHRGICKDITDVFEPNTEADMMAVITQFLIFWGNVVGRNHYIQVDATRHHFNEFGLVVGDSSKSRKGTSLNIVKYLLGIIHPNWIKECVASGLSSGEGLIYHVRDAKYKEEEVTKNGKTKIKTVLVDSGVKDKRLLVTESEFSNVLKMNKRDGNTLSDVIRNSWDGNNLGTLTKADPTRSTSPHISIIGHITFEEFSLLLNQTDIFNGFANRFLFCCSRRKHLLPFPKPIDELDLGELKTKLTSISKFSELNTGPIQFDSDARELWISLYPQITQPAAGAFGASTARSETHIIRIAGILSLLDCNHSITANNLEYAIELWQFYESSAHYIFNKSSNALPRNHQKIISLLRSKPDGVIRSHILKNLLNRNISSDTLNKIKNDLINKDYILIQKIGRAEIWKIK